MYAPSWVIAPQFGATVQPAPWNFQITFWLSAPNTVAVNASTCLGASTTLPGNTETTVICAVALFDGSTALATSTVTGSGTGAAGGAT